VNIDAWTPKARGQILDYTVFSPAPVDIEYMSNVVLSEMMYKMSIIGMSARSWRSAVQGSRSRRVESGDHATVVVITAVALTQAFTMGKLFDM
jgi:hypothetical protein